MGEDTTTPVYLIANDDSTERVEYFLSEAKVKTSNVRIIGIDDSKYTLEMWVDNNSLVYVVNEGEVSNRFFYEKL